ncbi:MAG: hypothetical protein HQ541_23010 [Mariniphaga sp.]|nr:hypothetical protein [Mariniphaga sp.]
MRKLPFIVGLLFIFINTWAQSPHGEKLLMDCADCHTTGSWVYAVDSSRFEHNDQTDFTLEGQHQYTDCKKCHETLIFSDAQSECFSCHTDMHNTTVGTDCARCHDANSWIVENITELHQQGRFPLLGAHNTADCSNCHTSASRLEFEPLGINCIDCHRQNFFETTEPNHQQAGFSENCFECHDVNAHEWSSKGFIHSFFLLNKGHKIDDCAVCHGNNILEPISNECYSCHLDDYNEATNPQHDDIIFSTSCEQCHTIDPDWQPARFETHDQFYFPVYSGSHRGEWNNCNECHTNPLSYFVFDCTNCHEVSKMDQEHRDESGYSSDNNACFACHPQGNKEGAFNHNNTAFPLKGAHTSTGCLECHSEGYGGTSTLCNSCHSNEYIQANDPKHSEAGISTECEICHNENSWKPSDFNHNETGFELEGGHSGRQCSECHQGTTVGALTECYSCHQQNYEEAENHLTLGYPLECTVCHSVTTWEESEFDHNDLS